VYLRPTLYKPCRLYQNYAQPQFAALFYVFRICGQGVFLYFRPETLDEAVHVLAHSGGQILAGGTDFFPALGDRPVIGSVVDISGVRELGGVVTEPKYVKIGGLTTWTDVINAPLPRCFDGLKAAAREIGSIQIQNRATVAGNLCNASPAADSVPPLLTLDAEVELASQAGTRRLPLGDFIVGNRKTVRQPGEILSQILVPRTVENAASVFLKLGARRYLVISIAMVAAIIQKDSRNRVTDARVSVGSCSAVARRLPTLEQMLIGVPAGPGLGSLVTTDHLHNLSPIGDVRATAAYRRDAALRLVQRALDECVGSS
jgi:CO/xanthine dehydrogenase FAD-binding subunit